MDGMDQLYRRQDLPLKDVLVNLNLQQKKITVAGLHQLSLKQIPDRQNHHVNMMKCRGHHFFQGGKVLAEKTVG